VSEWGGGGSGDGNSGGVGGGGGARGGGGGLYRVGKISFRDVVRASIHAVHPGGNARSQKSITPPPPDDDCYTGRTYSLASSRPVSVSHSRTLHKPPRYPFNPHRARRRTTTLPTTSATATHTYAQLRHCHPPSFLSNPPSPRDSRASDKRPRKSTHARA